jgi:ATP-binding cassette subfamily C protein LapB
MDEHTEHHALEALRAAMETHHTVVLVAHKPVLLDIIDRILVLTPEGVTMDGPRDLMIERLRQRTAPPRTHKPTHMEVVA